MALFEIIIELPNGLNSDALAIAAKQAGYTDATISSTESATLFSVLVSHPKSSFEIGHVLAQAILEHLPPQSKYHSHRSSVSIKEMSVDDLDNFLHEIENSTYGQVS
jgi:hypothetical protein